MPIRVYVTPNAKQARVVKVSEDYFEVWIDEKPMGGRANKRLLEILAEYFNIPKSRITILRGSRTRNKTIRIGLSRTANRPSH
jgi:uncharacterized protein (TIGR00251 family)